MAHLAPSDLTPAALKGAHSGELATLAMLQRELPGDNTVFHGVHWTREWRKAAAFGEADFVIVNRSGDVAIVEQKNGPLEEGPDALVKVYGSERKDVGRQIHRTLDAVRDKLGLHRGPDAPTLDYLLYCPDYRLKTLHAVGLERSRIVDAPARAELAGRIAALIGPGEDTPIGRRVRRFFENACELVPDIHAHVMAGERAMVRLSGGLAATVGCIEMSPLRLRVRGTAGSGKSAVAARAFARLVETGRKPLLVCFNRPLAEKLKAAVGPGGKVATVYGFFADFLKARGVAIDWTTMRADPDFWRRVVDQATTETAPDEWLFDALIVDEGQDFEPDWVDVLQLFLRSGAEMLWLEDPDQALSRREATRLDGFVGYRCRANHRSPVSIARFVQRTLPFQFEIANDLPGLGVGVSLYREATEQSATVARLVSGLIGQGFRHSDIAVLSLGSLKSATLAGAQKVGPFTLRRFTDQYDLLGNQVASAGQLLFDTVRRFKGQQAPAVIVTDVDLKPDRLEEELRLLFCAATRATVRLDLVARRGSPRAEQLLEAAA